MRIIQSKDLFLSQSALTGESEPVEKFSGAVKNIGGALTEIPNFAFMGSNVISGSAAGVVAATGDDTLHARHASHRPAYQRFQQRQLDGSGVVRAVNSGRAYTRNVADDCNNLPCKRRGCNVAEKSHHQKP